MGPEQEQQGYESSLDSDYNPTNGGVGSDADSEYGGNSEASWNSEEALELPTPSLSGDEDGFSSEGSQVGLIQSSRRGAVDLNASTDSLDRLRLIELESSVFKVFTSGRDWDFSEPYRAPIQNKWTGSGFAVEHEGETFLVTNSHVAGKAKWLGLRKPNDSTKYEASCYKIDPDCDLALLKVSDDAFFEGLNPLKLGDMPKLRTKVQIYGFPMGGQELCVTDGQISRIERSEYAEGNAELLQAQTSAAINPGNSGGPAFAKGDNGRYQVIGVAFQGYDVGEGLGYLIPPPVIKHFLNDGLDHEYGGFPVLEIQTQVLTSAPLREHLGMNDPSLAERLGTEKISGIRVKKVPSISAANELLKKDDVLLSVDGIAIGNDGFIKHPTLGRVHYEHLIDMHMMHDDIRFEVLREGRVTQVDVCLSHRANTVYKARTFNDAPPTFFIQNGLVIQPLTDNYINDSSSFFSGAGHVLEKLQQDYREHPDDEVVILNHVLQSKDTVTYDSFEKKIIDEINGVKVRNCRQALQLFQDHDERFHEVTFKNGDKIVFANDDQVHDQILEDCGILKSQSKDLGEEPALALKGYPEFFPMLRRRMAQELEAAKTQQEAAHTEQENSNREIRSPARLGA